MAENMQIELNQLWDEWENGQIATLSAATLKRYRGVFHQFVKWFNSAEMRSPLLSDWHPITLAGYRQYLKQVAAARTFNTHLSALRQFGDWLIAQSHTDTNPARRLKMVQLPAQPAPSALESGQVNALLRSIQLTRNPERNTAVIQMMLQTGLRISECVQLFCRDIEFGERRGVVTVRYGKGDKTRRVPLNKSARQALADYVALRLEVNSTLKAIAKAWSRLPTQQPLWLSERGTQLSAREIGRMFQQQVQFCAARDTVPHQTTLHSLRHTFATHYLKRHPGDLVGLAWLLGHASVRTTQVYVQPTEQEMARRVDAILLNAYAD
jgi:site-specific recombinase XerD